MTDAQRTAHYINELNWVAARLREGRAGEQDIESLVLVIQAIRQATPSTSPEAEINREYVAAKQAENIAAEKIGAHYWPLVKAAASEKEARALLARIPDCVEKVFFIDHMVFVSKVLPKPERPVAPRVYSEDEALEMLKAKMDAERGENSAHAWPKLYGKAIYANALHTLARKIRLGGVIAQLIGLRRVNVYAYVETAAKFTPPPRWTEMPPKAKGA